MQVKIKNKPSKDDIHERVILVNQKPKKISTSPASNAETWMRQKVNEDKNTI